MKKYSFAQHLSIACVVFLTGLGAAQAADKNAVDEAAQACIDAAQLIQEEDDLEGAIEEATWCLTGLKQLQEEIKLSIFPDELNGFIGGDINNQSLMGMTIIERDYSRDSKTISLSLTTSGGAGGDVAAGGLGALAELGKLFGAMENAGAAGGKKIRIQKRTVIVADEGGMGVLNVQLKSGGTLKVQSSDLLSDELVEFMREFPIIELDDAMAI